MSDGPDGGPEEHGLLLVGAVFEDPELMAGMAARGFAVVGAPNSGQAAEMAERHIQLSPGDKRSLRIRLDAYRGTGDVGKAEEALKALVSVDPEGADNE